MTYICRTHGEPLVENLMTFRLECPEIQVCGTWVGHEVLATLLPWQMRLLAAQRRGERITMFSGRKGPYWTTTEKESTT